MSGPWGSPSETLTSAKAGITRLREKGGASPETLYELTNGYVDQARSVVQRPGTVHERAFAGTKGFCTFAGKFHVFASSVVDPGDPRFVVNVVKHPNLNDATLREIHFAEPFLGYLYVSAEFDNGDTYHFWLQATQTWQPNAVYRVGDVVRPSVPNGYVYRAQRIGLPFPVWAANVKRAIGDKVEPTAANVNGFYYEVIDVIGSDPRSGANEPTWPAADGATVFEDSGNPTPTPPPTNGGGAPPLPPDVAERYARDAIRRGFS
ncbi:hypothetical protein [Lysobacter sp. CA199]|uniref:hypothetical protein n=1 Tax=Lysobacter sp. CA199 TaxID=3455608 RepID=UPI003F8D41E8